MENILSWDDYWSTYDKMCQSLIERDYSSITKKLINAKSWVDNLDEEWFEFYYSLDYIIDENRDKFNEIEHQYINSLRSYLHQYLSTL
jgi:hypothetical protein